MRLLRIIAILFFTSSCISPQSDESESPLLGTWKAQWVTNPASFPGVSDVKSFSMDGEITFYSDSAEINAYGFPGCIFSSDTLRHSLKWVISSDTLSFLNEDDVYGMSYKIKEIKERAVELQLMEDIFLSLKK